MDNDQIKSLAEKFGVAPGVVSSLYAEARKDIESESLQAADEAAQQKTDMLLKADEAARAGNLQQSIALRRRAHGVQVRI